MRVDYWACVSATPTVVLVGLVFKVIKVVKAAIEGQRGWKRVRLELGLTWNDGWSKHKDQESKGWFGGRW